MATTLRKMTSPLLRRWNEKHFTLRRRLRGIMRMHQKITKKNINGFLSTESGLRCARDYSDRINTLSIFLDNLSRSIEQSESKSTMSPKWVGGIDLLIIDIENNIVRMEFLLMQCLDQSEARLEAYYLNTQRGTEIRHKRSRLASGIRF